MYSRPVSGTQPPGHTEGITSGIVTSTSNSRPNHVESTEFPIPPTRTQMRHRPTAQHGNYSPYYQAIPSTSRTGYHGPFGGSVKRTNECKLLREEPGCTMFLIQRSVPCDLSNTCRSSMPPPRRSSMPLPRRSSMPPPRRSSMPPPRRSSIPPPRSYGNATVNMASSSAPRSNGHFNPNMTSTSTAAVLHFGSVATTVGFHTKLAELNQLRRAIYTEYLRSLRRLLPSVQPNLVLYDPLYGMPPEGTIGTSGAVLGA